MTKENTVALISILHDPQARMAPFLPACLPFLTQLYQFLLVIATPATASATIEPLAQAGIQVDDDGNEHIGENRRRALTRGLQRESAYFHYCDFDRLLHWTLFHSEELRELVQNGIHQADYTVLGRTPSAFASHPRVQQELEGITNEFFSFAFGQRMDVTAGSCGISRATAQYLVQHSRELSNATDTEWPMLVGCEAGLQVNYLAMQGLAFETGTFYGKEIFHLAENAENWARRARLARASIEAVVRISNGPGSLEL